MKETMKKDVGTLVISEDVIAQIASTAALNIPGVAKVAPPVVDLKGILHQKEQIRAVKVNNSGDHIVIDIHLALNSGAKIKPTMEAVQESIKEEVQTMTGKVVTKVNAFVEDVAFPAE